MLLTSLYLRRILYIKKLNPELAVYVFDEHVTISHFGDIIIKHIKLMMSHLFT